VSSSTSLQTFSFEPEKEFPNNGVIATNTSARTAIAFILFILIRLEKFNKDKQFTIKKQQKAMFLH
jgi:hypothetical protein